MKPFIKFFAFVVLLGSMLHLSCKKEISCEGCAAKNNKPPIAIAGPDQVITLPADSVLLDGRTSSDPDGMISEWLWTKISGPSSFNILKPTDSLTKVKALAVGTYLFELKVTDNGGLSAKDTMRIIVDPVLTPNHPPIANAGADQTITLPINAVNLDGSASADPENNISNYMWTKISGPSSFNIVNTNVVQTQVTTLVQGTYQFELKVTDSLGLFSKDTMQVIVNAAVSNNLPPVAKAGNDTTIQTNQTSCAPIPVNITLNGSNSYDPDGTIVSYLWTGPGTISNPNSAITTVTGFFQGTVLFILKVTDNDGALAFDTVRILIVPANRPLVQAQLIPIGTLSQTRGNIVMAASNNKILFAGGGVPTGYCATSRVDIYDLNTNTWATSELSEARYGMGVAVLGNRIFFGGGFSPKNFPNSTTCYIGNSWYPDTRSSAVDIYDASTNMWSTSQLSTRRAPEGAAVNDKVIFGGGDISTVYFPSNVVDIYDATSNSWTNTLMAETKSLPQIATAGNKIYLAGGASSLDADNSMLGFSRRIDIYDAPSDLWAVDFLSTERAEMGSISTNNKIYWAGGYVLSSDPNSYYPETTSSVEIRDLTTNTTSFDCLSKPRAPVTAVKKNNKLLFFEGYDSTFDIYDLTTNSWSIGVLPQNLLWSSIISYNNVLYVAGGEINGIVSNQVYKLEF